MRVEFCSGRVQGSQEPVSLTTWRLRLTWQGHVARPPPPPSPRSPPTGSFANRLLRWNPQGQRRRERPKDDPASNGRQEPSGWLQNNHWSTLSHESHDVGASGSESQFGLAESCVDWLAKTLYTSVQGSNLRRVTFLLFLFCLFCFVCLRLGVYLPSQNRHSCAPGTRFQSAVCLSQCWKKKEKKIKSVRSLGSNPQFADHVAEKKREQIKSLCQVSVPIRTLLIILLKKREKKLTVYAKSMNIRWPCSKGVRFACGWRGLYIPAESNP